jgi:hypothetical protein
LTVTADAPTLRILGKTGRSSSVEDRTDTQALNAADGPHPELVELSELLVGTWRVTGPGIAGGAEYQSLKSGSLLVAYVDLRWATRE